MPLQRARVAFPKSFNAVITRELLLSILRREVTDAGTAAQWLDRHAEASVN
jgi:hypothetical protein